MKANNLQGRCGDGERNPVTWGIRRQPGHEIAEQIPLTLRSFWATYRVAAHLQVQPNRAGQALSRLALHEEADLIGGVLEDFCDGVVQHPLGNVSDQSFDNVREVFELRKRLAGGVEEGRWFV